MILVISQKFPNFSNAYLAQFLSFDRVLGHFRKVLKSSKQCPWSHVILIYQSQVIVFDLKSLFGDFWKWPIMLKLITFCESISWTWNVKMSCRKFHPLNNELGMGFFWWTMKKVCLGQFAVDFFNCPKIETFASWDFLSHACGIMIKNWSNDDCGFKIRCWPKNLTFDSQMTILPLELTVEQLGFLTVQTGIVNLATWHVDAWKCV